MNQNVPPTKLNKYFQIKKTCITNQIEQLWSGLRADVQQVPEAPGDKQGRPFSLSLQKCVGRHRGAHSNPANQSGVDGLVARKDLSRFLRKR